MIEFDAKTSVFRCDNGSISYYFYLNDVGDLETLYFGRSLPSIFDPHGIRKANIDNGSTQYFDVETGQEKSYEDAYKSTYARLEVASHGWNDKRGAPIILRKENGSYRTVFHYVSHKIYGGIHPLEGLPSANGNEKECETLEILLKEETEEIYVTYFFTIYANKDILVKNFSIENRSAQPIHILRMLSMQLDLPHPQYRMHHFRGRWSKERDWIINDVHDGIQEVSSNYGRSSHEENPFVFLSEQNASMDHGEVIGFNLIYSGNFLFRLFSDAYQGLRVLYGINDEDFDWYLEPNAQFVTPQAVISYSSQGIDTMSQNFHAFIKQNLITYADDRLEKSILFNSWEGCYFDFTTESILDYIQEAKKIGSELFVLDDGWFGRRDTDEDGLGDWTIQTKKIDLTRVIHACHQLGMRFGLWFEPEMVNPTSDFYQQHPTFALAERGAFKQSMLRHQFHLDFSSEQVVEAIYQQMIKILDQYAIDYIKWDYNRVVIEHCSAFYPAHQQGEIYHRLVLGYFQLLERLTMRYPHILFEGCASGGGRFDLGTLYYCPQIWASDESNPIQRLFIQYHTSLGYPLSTIGSHVNANPITSYRTKACIALFGTYGYEMNPTKLTDSERKELSDVAEIYKKFHHSVIAEGVVYHLLSPTQGNAMCMQSVSSSKHQSLVLHVNLLKEMDRFRFIKLKGLDEHMLYRNSYDHRVYSGAYYMQVGINLSREWMNEFTCHLIELEKVN